MTSNSFLDKMTLIEALSLRRDASKIINESIPTTSTQKNYLSMPTPHTQNPSSGSTEIPSFDEDYIPTSKIPSELNITALSDHQIKGEALEHLRQIISDIIFPSSWTRVPHKMGSPSHGSLSTDVVRLTPMQQHIKKHVSIRRNCKLNDQEYIPFN
ncbi:hypothetical protein O181_065980 [Austropuccinia psidii MF-1]|uniref:Uncharacterized protein n=1 Tax=Austropuccinia psidii MF-1 TaxID=1389203 RepID=A0A9Q3EW66_9BASI|nr:hypothetical protein [Austropuccinia psidii MF-1]